MLLRLVHLEDDLNDRDLVADILRGDGIVCTVTSADSREAFEVALAERPDLILSDFTLPGFDGIAAQQMASGRYPDVPFVFVSGSIGDDVAVERLKCGATDYVLKQRLERLPQAVRRAIHEAGERRQRVEAELALRRLNAELESRVNDRTQSLRVTIEALEAARAEADRANRAKSEFLSRMSHDLRTPLSAIMGFAQMLQLDSTTPEQSESLTQILRGGRHLLDLINEVLDIARIEAGRMSVSAESIVLSEIVDHAIELVQPLLAERGITLKMSVTPGAHVFGDWQRLTQILLNLLSNAVKYNRDKGQIRVTAAAYGAERIRITVADTGRGISPEKLTLLFTPFERLGAYDLGVEGTGLGLAMAKGLAAAMNGTLGVESVVDEGTAFTLELPSCEAVALRDGGARPGASDAACVSGTVLYVEDNLPNVLLMRRVLARHRPGIELLHAGSGRAGLDIVRETAPDLIVLDSHLPDISGEEVLTQLWASLETRHIPVIVLSADATTSRQRELMAAGAKSYMTKPFDVAELLRLIDSIVGPKGSMREQTIP